MSKIKSCKILSELSLTDAGANVEDCLLSALADNGVLGNFTKAVILVSSVKDYYVPYYSTRLEVSVKARTDVRVGHAIVKMAADTLSQIDSSRLMRVVLDNNVDETRSNRLDTLTGRAAHSELLLLCFYDLFYCIQFRIWKISLWLRSFCMPFIHIYSKGLRDGHCVFTFT